MFILCLGR